MCQWTVLVQYDSTTQLTSRRNILLQHMWNRIFICRGKAKHSSYAAWQEPLGSPNLRLRMSRITSQEGIK